MNGTAFTFYPRFIGSAVSVFLSMTALMMMGFLYYATLDDNRMAQHQFNIVADHSRNLIHLFAF
jgi:hypothetical protein